MSSKELPTLTGTLPPPVSIFVAFCCACANGYDGSLMTSVIAMPTFQAATKVNGKEIGDTGSKVSVIFSLYSV